MDDGLDRCRSDVVGAEELFLNIPAISIFNAWADEPWVNEGAAVRVSLVCFGVDATTATLNGQAASRIHADLTGGDGLDLTLATPLTENANASFEGTKKYGDFDIPGALARQWLGVPNPHGLSNAQVVKPWRNGQDLSKRHSDTWIVDFGVDMAEADAALFDLPFTHVLQQVKPARFKASLPKDWWLHERARPAMRTAMRNLPRFIATTRVSKHRYFVFLDACVLPDSRLNAIARADDTTFGILSSRIHEVWSLAQASMHGVGNDPTYNAKSCFETYPFPAGLTPADTAHQRTETLPDGAIIPADIYKKNSPLDTAEQAQTATKTEVTASAINPENWGQSPISPQTMPASGHAKLASDPNFPTAVTSSGAVEQRRTCAKSASGADSPHPPAPQPPSLRQTAIAIAQAAKKLNDLRDNWLNPPEWTHRVPEVIPLGMEKSPYPDRIEPRPGIRAEDLKALQKRTLTNLYNAAPAWLKMAHQQLDRAVAAAYGWRDYSAVMPDEDILKRLLALNLARSAPSA